jgi:hypothetical protein
MSGNLIIAAGVVLIGLGTWMTIHGARLNSKRDSVEVEQRIDAAVSRMDQLAKSAAPDSQRAQQMQEVQDEFSIWAEKFKREAPQKKLEWEKSQLNQRTVEMSVSQKWRPYVQKTVGMLRRAIEAYNVRSDSKVELNETPTPENICSGSSTDLATVVFSPSVAWRLQCFIDRPVTESTSPSVLIYFVDKPDRLGGSYVAISFDAAKNTFRIYGRGERIPAPIDVSPTALTGFDATVGQTIRELLEAQILSL